MSDGKRQIKVVLTERLEKVYHFDSDSFENPDKARDYVMAKWVSADPDFVLDADDFTGADVEACWDNPPRALYIDGEPVK